MANLDTRNKRGSALLLDLPFSRVWPNADGDLTTLAKRQHMAGKYASGFIAAAIAWFNGLTTSLLLTGAGN